jgi:hypothetical protein
MSLQSHPSYTTLLSRQNCVLSVSVLWHRTLYCPVYLPRVASSSPVELSITSMVN